MTPSEILRKHEDANEMHFHEVDRKFIIEAMEEYAKEKSEKPINLSSQQTAVEWLVEQVFGKHTYVWNDVIEQAKQMEREQIINAHLLGLIHSLEMEATKQAEEYYNQTYNKNK